MNINANFKIIAGVDGQKQVDDLHAAVKKLGKEGEVASGQIKAAFRQLPVQFTDIATQLAGGQNPLLILLQQGGQIKDSFGGIVPAVRAVASVLTPVRLLIGGVATAITTLGVAAFQGADEINTLNKSMALTGNYAATTAGQVDAAVQRIRAATGATAGAARELVMGAAGSGAFSPQTMEAAATAMARIQKLSGQTGEEVLKSFSAMTRGVSQWAAEHNRQYHYLTAEQFKHIQQLERQGRTEEALKANIDALNASFKGRTAELGLLERTWNRVKEAASGAWDAMKGIGRAETADDRLRSMRERLDNLLRLQEEGVRGSRMQRQVNPEVIRQLREEIAATEQKMRVEDEARRKKAAADADEQRKIDELASGTAFAKQQAAQQIQLVRLQNASAARIHILDEEKAKLDALQRSGLIDSEEYNRKALDIERRTLAERAELIRQEFELERTRETKDQVDAMARLQRLEVLRGQLADAVSAQRTQAIIAAAPAKNNFGDDLKSLNAELAKLQFQSQHVQTFGDRIMSAREAVVQFEITSGKWSQLLPDQKAKLLETARAIDEYQNALQRQLAGLEYDKQTKAIETNTASLEKSTLQRQIAAALQELENRGIREGTELYTQLAERRIEALRKANEAQKSYTTGVRQGMNEYLETVENRAGAAKEAFLSAMRGMEDALVNFVMTGKLNFADFARSVIADIARIWVRQQLIAPLVKGLGSMVPGGGADWTSGFDLMNANGNAFDRGRVMPFANGGVVSRPTLFPMANGTGLMGEAGPEAIMPLRRGRDGKLGVVAQGSNTTVVNVTVNADTGQQQGDGQGRAAQLGGAIAAAVRQELINQKRPGGLLAAA